MSQRLAWKFWTKKKGKNKTEKMVAPVLEAILAGLLVGFVNRMLARMEQRCPDEARRDDSSESIAASGTEEIPHMM